MADTLCALLQLLQQYSKESLSQQKLTELGKVINELRVLTVIHKRCTLEGQSIIDRVVTDKARILRDIIKPSKGIFARMSFWKQQEPIEIDSVWKEVVTLKEPKCLVLIEDMARLKGYNIGP